MTTAEQPPAVDMDKLMGFAFRAVGDIGATVNTALVVMGDRLGLYRAMAGAGPLTPAELAQRTIEAPSATVPPDQARPSAAAAHPPRSTGVPGLPAAVY